MPFTVYSDTRKAILSEIPQVAEALGLNVAWPNMPFRPVNGRPWLAIYIVYDDALEETITGNQLTGNRYYGSITLQLHNPKQVGSDLLTGRKDVLSGIFSKRSIPCGTTRIVCGLSVPISEFEDGDWYVVNIVTEFNYLVL